MKFILGKKLNMLQIFREDGTVVPVTKVEAGPCVVTQVKSKAKDGTEAVQIGFGAQKRFRLNKPALGHLKDINVKGDETMTVRVLRDHRVDEKSELKRGDVFTVKIFKPGERVQVVGTSKGKGFQGVVKRHGFHGGPATHGHKDNERAPGSIGAGGVQRVFKGMRMAGHMGDARVTVKNLEIISVNPEANEILIKGALPGARNSIVLISTDEGKIEV
ncbi:MAG: 50S ribosomal protein L3 [Candidatus Magasanikbacteria bacterium]|nr:50S ribosomal protein L3 [Candidatus Magasanikbacteria bacterium]